MADKDSIANNPFAALFPSIVDAQLFAAGKSFAQNYDEAGQLIDYVLLKMISGFSYAN